MAKKTKEEITENGFFKTKEVFPKTCHYCGEPINHPRDLVYKYVLLRNGERKYYLRELHYECAPKITDMTEVEQRKIETTDKDKCYEVMKKWLNKDKSNKPLGKYAMNRLLGLRVGKKFAKGDNVYGVEKGYGFDVIYATMIFSSLAVESALAKREFNDERHRVNYIMSIVESNVDFIKGKMKKRERESEMLNHTIDELNSNAVFFSNFNADSFKPSKRKTGIKKELQEKVKDIEGDDFSDLFD